MKSNNQIIGSISGIIEVSLLRILFGHPQHHGPHSPSVCVPTDRNKKSMVCEDTNHG
jgi:hypothetical protein